MRGVIPVAWADLRTSGWVIDRQRVQRLWREEGLRSKVRKIGIRAGAPSKLFGVQQFSGPESITRSSRSGSDGLFDDQIPRLESDSDLGSVAVADILTSGREYGKIPLNEARTVALQRRTGTLSSRVRVTESVDSPACHHRDPSTSNSLSNSQPHRMSNNTVTGPYRV